MASLPSFAARCSGVQLEPVGVALTFAPFFRLLLAAPRSPTVAAKIHPIPPGHARVFFYREQGHAGARMKPDVDLDGEKIGKSNEGGFFFIDRLPGAYMVSTTTETKYEVQLDLEAQQTIYVNTKIGMGFWVDRVRPVLEEQEVAMKTLRKCRYIGYLEELGGKPRKHR